MMDSQPLVSIIIPTYNGEKRIARTLGAITDQDYGNLEIIVVDDVSTDDTVETARRALEDSGRKFRIIERTINGRQSASRNTGLDAANGKYVIFFDHDDLADADFVSSLCAEAEAKKADVVFCGIKEYHEDNGQYTYNPVRLKSPPASSKDYLTMWARHELDLCYVWCCIFRRDFLVSNGLRFPEKCYISEDLELVLKAIALSESTSFVPKTLYTYVRHSGQQSTAEYSHRRDHRIFRQAVLSEYRAARVIIRNTSSSYVKDYALSFLVAHEILKEFTLTARDGDKERYMKMLKVLRHRKIRQMMMCTVKFMFVEPEMFFKSMVLLYAPKLYYRLRNKPCPDKQDRTRG